MIGALLLATIAFVPLDDRPVTRQLPQLLGRIAGVPVLEPPKQLLGNYLDAGKPDAIMAWLNGTQATRADNFVVSSDAHAPEEFAYVPMGAWMARRAGIPADRILNWDLDSHFKVTSN